MKVVSLALLCALLLCGVSRGDAQWRKLDINLEAPVTRLLSRTVNLVAGTSGNGVFRSIDNGKTWQEISNGLPNRNVNDIYGFGFTYSTDVELYAATQGDGVYTWPEKGTAWRAYNDGMSARFVRAIVNGLYALVYTTESQEAQSRLYYQRQNWQEVRPPNNNLKMERLFIALPLVYLAYEGELYVSNMPANWTQIGRQPEYPKTIATGAIFHQTPQPNYYVSTESSGVIWTADALASRIVWQDYSQGLTTKRVNGLIEQAGMLYAITPEGVFRRKEGDPAWHWYSIGLTDFDVTAITAHDNKLFVGTKSGQVFVNDGPIDNVTLTSSASFSLLNAAPNSICTLFGGRLAVTTSSAQSLPLPTDIVGTRVFIQDARGRIQIAPLFFVSPSQVNFLFTSNLANGPVQIEVTRLDFTKARGVAYIRPIVPALYAANGNGKDEAVALHLQVKPVGSQVYTPATTWDAAQGKFVLAPIRLSSEAGRDYLILFGTGLRKAPQLTIFAKGVNSSPFALAPSFYGEVQGVEGLDQINVALPLSLRGQGIIELSALAENTSSNTLKLWIE